MSQVLEEQFLRNAQIFIPALDTTFSYSNAHTEQTYALLGDASTTFVVIPERDALLEASFFVDRLTVEQIPLAGLVVNRVQTTHVASLNEG